MASSSLARLPALLPWLVIAVGLPSVLHAGGPLRVNEFQASNLSTVFDEDGDPSDWLELHNSGAVAIDLTGYHLTDDPLAPTQWTFPAVTLPAGGFMVVFCSDKDRTDPLAPLHTNFKLSSDGEYLALLEPGGSIVADEYAPAYPAQFDAISFGHGIAGELRYFAVPTPNAPNGAGFEGRVGIPSVSVESGFFDAAFAVSLAPAEPSDSVYFTTDGSVPSALNGTLYTGPVTIDTTTILRVTGVRADFIDSPDTSRTYLFLADVIEQPYAIPGFPNPPYSVGSGGATVVHDYEMDPLVVGDPAYTAEMIPALEAIPTLSIVVDPDAIFGLDGFYDGDDEVPGTVELLFPNDPARNERVRAGVQSHSDLELKRSLRLDFKALYGFPSWETTLFADGAHGATAADDHDRVVLRAGANRSWARNWNPDETAYTIDTFYRDSQIALSGFGSRSAFVHLYINGLYWGLYNPVERPDADFSASYFGGSDDDWFELSHGGNPSGDSSRYDELFGVLVGLDLSDPANYAEVEAILDVDATIDYWMLNWWSGTGDWPNNNWWLGNRSPASPDGATPLRYYAWDGEWSWDAPFGFSNPGMRAHVHPQFRTTATPVSDLAVLWHALRVNPEFLLRFADRVQAACFHDGALSDAVATQRWLDLNATIASAVVAESARWGDALESLGDPLRTRDVHWQNEVDTIASLLAGNAEVFVAALRVEGYFPSIDAPDLVPYGGDLALGDTITLTNPSSSGTIYYTTDGNDPRLPGGAIHPSANAYTGPFAIAQPSIVRARILATGEWSALESAAFGLPQPSPIRLTEFMYHPPSRTADEIAAGILDDDDLEYLELQNLGASPIELADHAFVDGIEFAFPPLLLPVNGVVILAKDPTAFAVRYPTVTAPVLGPYDANLSNGGELVVWADASGTAIHSFVYDDESPWDPAADGNGSALEVIDPFGDYGDASNWSATPIYGTPGTTPFGSTGEPEFIRGDCNGDLTPDISDPITLLADLFPTGTPPSIPCRGACDANDDGQSDISDVVAMLAALFGSGDTPPQPLPAPSGSCGVDPTVDSIGCSNPPCP